MATCAGGAVGLGPQGDGALGDRVVVVGEADGEGLEQRVKGREVRALDVPVGDLDLAVQVEAVGEARVERDGDLLAGGLGRGSGWCS